MASSEEAHALVVTITKYDKLPPLRAYDCEELLNTLDCMSFTVTVVNNPDLKSLRLAVKLFVESVMSGESVFVFVAGRGAQTADDVYLIPSDYGCSPARANPIRHALALFEMLLIPLKDRRSRLDFVVFDNCASIASGCGMDHTILKSRPPIL